MNRKYVKYRKINQIDINDFVNVLRKVILDKDIDVTTSVDQFEHNLNGMLDNHAPEIER